ncbi:hypothetical protein HMPREF9370_0958 [Neisseria wadsworthii 9715]|uniref:Uncharacterized protein n=1 Tax=Neisseria wadsworthii 9715 TaxID=1030841 RepID=G4CPE8_9NEIS|nr:hypothetical protein HMPREF9370_0958 [Neisseria wadsworthii 9715]
MLNCINNNLLDYTEFGRVFQSFKFGLSQKRFKNYFNTVNL